MAPKHGSAFGSGSAPDTARKVKELLGGVPARSEFESKSNPLPGYENASIDYPNVSALSRPLGMPKNVRTGMRIALAAAAVIGVILIGGAYDTFVNGPAREQQAIVESLSQPVNLDIPALQTYLSLDDQTMLDELKSAGFTLYERTPIGTMPGGGFEVIRLNDNVTMADAALMYSQGFSNLSASEAVKLLNGSWELSVSRENGTSIIVHYVDFASQSVEEAISNAISLESLSGIEASSSGTDDVGNTYAEGVVTTDSGTYSWRVSALPLSEMYNVHGLPETASYVGIRFSAQP